jgi:GNAT superfamily N-acetyltransferase
MGQILVMEIDETVIGMVSLLYSVSTALGGKVAILEDMIVDENFRGQGLGSELLAEAIHFARAGGCKRLTLLTDFDNDSAIEFYKKAGFVGSKMVPMRLFV